VTTERTLGSLDPLPKHHREWGDDCTATRALKADAMRSGVDLTLPVRSMRAHRQARTRIIVGIVCVAVVLALALRWAWRYSYGL
jgi:hypothetical protein